MTNSGEDSWHIIHTYPLAVTQTAKGKHAFYNISPSISKKHRLPRWPRSKDSACQCRRRSCRFDPWVRKIPERAPVFLPGKSHGQRKLLATVHGIAKILTLLSTHGCEKKQKIFPSSLQWHKLPTTFKYSLSLQQQNKINKSRRRRNRDCKGKCFLFRVYIFKTVRWWLKSESLAPNHWTRCHWISQHRLPKENTTDMVTETTES